MLFKHCRTGLSYVRCCKIYGPPSTLKTVVNLKLKAELSQASTIITRPRPRASFSVNEAVCSLNGRSFSTDTSKPKMEEDMSLKHHWVESCDDGSNLKRIVLAKPRKLSAIDIELEKRREETFAWNREFWRNHNAIFFKQKKDFALRATEKAESSRSEKDISDEMSVFYKDFLDKNYILHMNYNREWYKRNFGLLLLSLKASVTNFLDRLKS